MVGSLVIAIQILVETRYGSWMDGCFGFFVLFNNISVILGRWNGDHEWLCLEALFRFAENLASSRTYASIIMDETRRQTLSSNGAQVWFAAIS